MLALALSHIHWVSYLNGKFFSCSTSICPFSCAYLPEISVSTVVRLRLFCRRLDIAAESWYFAVYRFVPLNISALFLALAEILLRAISEAAFPFVLTKVGAFVFFFSFSTILHRVNDLLTPWSCSFFPRGVIRPKDRQRHRVCSRRVLRGVAFAVGWVCRYPRSKVCRGGWHN